MMFGKQVGYYRWQSVVDYLFPQAGAVAAMNDFLPQKEHLYYFPSGREALASIIQELNENADRKIKVALPAWSCSILYSLLQYKAVEIVPIAVHAPEMKMDPNDILDSAPDVVILVAENGALYDHTEIQRLKDAGITTIGDHCLALRNYSEIKDLACDFHLFSGGFSKPLSSFGLGMVSTDRVLQHENEFHRRFSLKNLFLVFAHVLLQNPFLYRFFKRIIGEPAKEVFLPSRSHAASLRNIHVLLGELRQFSKDKEAYQDLQHKIFSILKMPEPDFLLSKVVVPVSKLSARGQVHFHHQYPWTTENEDDTVVGNSIRRINNDYISFAVNRSCIRYSSKFIHALKRALPHASDQT